MKGAFVVVLLLSACSSVIPRVGPVQPARPGLPGRGAAIDSIPDPARPRVTRTDNPRQRTQCRTQSFPDGWAITAYRSGSDCPRVADTDFNMMVIESIQHHRYGEVIPICADQRVPSGWIFDSDENTWQCPGARVSEGKPTAMRIRRTH